MKKKIKDFGLNENNHSYTRKILSEIHAFHQILYEFCQYYLMALIHPHNVKHGSILLQKFPF